MDAGALLSWFDAHQRPLPWRTTRRDPYRTWVSEVMAQQTRIDTVLRYYAPFLRRFPDVRALAEAPEDALMKSWEGLGYYRRARLMQRGARAMLEQHGGHVPESFDALLALPGFGSYTAGAVASLCFGAPVPAVDGNVLRVASRMLAMEDDVATPAARRRVEDWVRRHQPEERPGAFNEALMELGATVCTPRAPRCGACPIAPGCAASALDAPLSYPVKARRGSPSPEVRVALAIARRGPRLLLEKRADGLLAGTWGLPWVEVDDAQDPADALAALVERLTGAPARVLPEPLARGRHIFSHRRWRMEAYAVEADGEGGEWHEPASLALGTAHRRLLDDLAREGPRRAVSHS